MSSATSPIHYAAIDFSEPLTRSAEADGDWLRLPTWPLGVILGSALFASAVGLASRLVAGEWVASHFAW